jgi:hypothetical protein
MLSRRAFSFTLSNTVAQSVAAITAAIVAPRCMSGVKSTDPTYEDDRWLEAELASTAEMTAEERYARTKQHELMKKVLDKARNSAKAHVDAQAAKHNAELEEMKKQMAELNAKIAAASKK